MPCSNKTAFQMEDRPPTNVIMWVVSYVCIFCSGDIDPMTLMYDSTVSVSVYNVYKSRSCSNFWKLWPNNFISSEYLRQVRYQRHQVKLTGAKGHTSITKYTGYVGGWSTFDRMTTLLLLWLLLAKYTTTEQRFTESNTNETTTF